MVRTPSTAPRLVAFVAVLLAMGCGAKGAPPPAAAPVAEPMPGASPSDDGDTTEVAPASPAPSPAPAATGGPSSLADASEEGETVTLATLPDAERALANASSELDSLLAAAERDQEKKKSGEARAESSKPASAPSPRPADATCATACKALGSLRRAAAAVCRLTSAGDARCTEARATVNRNEQRLSACSCASTR